MAMHRKMPKKQNRTLRGMKSSGAVIIVVVAKSTRRQDACCQQRADRFRQLGRAPSLEERFLFSGQQGLGRERGEQVHDPGDDAGPASLVAGAKPSAVVAVKILVKQEAVAPVRIVLELLRAAEDGAVTGAVLEE